MDADPVRSGTFPVPNRKSFFFRSRAWIELKTYFELYSNRKPWINYVVTHLHPLDPELFRLDPEPFWLDPELFQLAPELFRLDPELFWLEGFGTGIVLLRI